MIIEIYGKYLERTREKRKEAGREYHKKNKERLNEISREYQKTNKDEIKKEKALSLVGLI